MVYSSLLEAVAACDNYHGTHTPFVFGKYTVGGLQEPVVEALEKYNQEQAPAPFVIDTKSIQFATWVDTVEKRTQVVRKLMDSWRDKNLFSALRGWRDELYPVYGDNTQTDHVAFTMERAASPLFGISTFGVHLNAYTYKEGQVHMWVARRALTKPTWPGLLDNCVAGGISYGYTPQETIVKECDEEASIPKDIAVKAQCVNVITYHTATIHGLQPETQFVYDLELPTSFSPLPQDGEVGQFYLWPLDKIKETILKGEWKPNCAMVAIDFMMRHSFITPENEPDYIHISYRLHRRLEYPTSYYPAKK
ncbi:NUDIX hydrolase domain-like protein [Pilobolus umbonatus]|nr:NUDIX hydrolase domain-like protein [Pilobolus umbonatus]